MGSSLTLYIVSEPIVDIIILIRCSFKDYEEYKVICSVLLGHHANMNQHYLHSAAERTSSSKIRKTSSSEWKHWEGKWKLLLVHSHQKYIWSSLPVCDNLCVLQQSTIIPAHSRQRFLDFFFFNFPKTHIKFLSFFFFLLLHHVS